jgi:lambda family phage portal protein
MTARQAAMRYRIKGTGIYVRPVRVDGNLPYEAAGQGRRATTWLAPSMGPNASLRYSQGTLINRSRDAVRKNPLADAIVSTVESNIVGTGIKPQWQTDDKGLNRDLAALWLEWTDESDADQRLDFYGQQALAMRGIVEAGEVFGRLRVRRPEDMTTVPLQLQLLESEFCPITETRALPGREIRNGIEFDLVGRRTAYWMYRQHPFDWSALGGVADLTPMAVPASEVAHVAILRRPGQIRGEPWLTRALIKLRDLDKYDDAELMRKQVAALIAGFITEPGEETDAFAGEVPKSDENGVALATWEPGTLQKLRPGEEVTFSTPTEVGATYEPFMREQKRAVAVAGGILYEQLTGDYSKVNDRTFRASVNEFRRRAAMWQHHVAVYQLCRPVASRWIDLALLAGLIRLPRGMEERALKRIKWVPQGWAYIHPVQEVDADLKAIRAGLKSRSDAVSERGESAEDIDRQTAEDNARADALGNAYDSDGRRPQSGAAKAPPDDVPDGGADAAVADGQAQSNGSDGNA